MKNLLVYVFCVGMFCAAGNVQAGEYQCVVSSTRAVDCEAYYEMKHACAFSTELNEKRTLELENGKPTFPAFCTECGAVSEIPKNCRAIRIAAYYGQAPDVAAETPAEVVTADVQNNNILQNAYAGFKIAIGKTWVWLKIALKGEDFELKNTTTPVAGVRG